MASEIRREPNADMRMLASTLRQMYLALTQEGFSTQEALVIIGQTIHAHSGGGNNG